MSAEVNIIEGPVTFIASRNVRPDAVEAYEECIEDLGTAARAVDGNLGLTVIKPGGTRGGEYVVVMHFGSHEKLQEWEESDEGKQLQRRLESIAKGRAKFSEVTGFEYWFYLPGTSRHNPPHRYKMVIVTVLALYALSICYAYTVNLWLDSLPDHLGTLIRVLVLVTVMTYVLMPLLTRLFARWLYPQRGSGGGEHAGAGK